MNKKQSWILIAGIIFATAALLFVPWQIVEKDGSIKSAGYGPLYQPPVYRTEHTVNVLGVEVSVDSSKTGNRIDVSVLLAELAAIALLTGGSYCLAADRKIEIHSQKSAAASDADGQKTVAEANR